MFSLDKAKFLAACEIIENEGRMSDGIGTLSEKSVHAVLKMTCESYADSREVKLGGYVADIVGEHGVIEIQTKSFRSLREKLEAFLPLCPVTIVWPCTETLWIRYVDLKTGETFPDRKSPLHQKPVDIFYETYAIRDLLAHDNLHFKIARIESVELRSVQKYKAKKHYRQLKLDRIPVNLLGEVSIESPYDWLNLLPGCESLTDCFTVKQMIEATHVDEDNVRLALKSLTAMGIVEERGKIGRARGYAFADK